MFLEGFLEVVFLFLDNLSKFFVLLDYFFCNFFVSFESSLLFFCFSPFKLLHMKVVGFLSPKFLLLVLLVRRYNSINDIGVDSQWFCDLLISHWSFFYPDLFEFLYMENQISNCWFGDKKCSLPVNWNDLILFYIEPQNMNFWPFDLIIEEGYNFSQSFIGNYWIGVGIYFPPASASAWFL